MTLTSFLLLFQHSNIHTFIPCWLKGGTTITLILCMMLTSASSLAFLSKSEFIQVYSNTTASVTGEKSEEKRLKGECGWEDRWLKSVSELQFYCCQWNSISAASSDSSQMGNQSCSHWSTVSQGSRQVRKSNRSFKGLIVYRLFVLLILKKPHTLIIKLCPRHPQTLNAEGTGELVHASY